jgi:hypothetical protein
MEGGHFQNWEIGKSGNRPIGKLRNSQEAADPLRPAKVNPITPFADFRFPIHVRQANTQTRLPDSSISEFFVDVWPEPEYCLSQPAGLSSRQTYFLFVRAPAWSSRHGRARLVPDTGCIVQRAGCRARRSELTITC